jgi:hypothetical protein
MRRLLQVRILIVLVALALIPAATLPFAERIRTEWARYWEPKPDVEEPVGASFEFNGSGAAFRVVSIRSNLRTGSPNSLLRFSEAQELGEAAGSIDRDSPAIER